MIIPLLLALSGALSSDPVLLIVNKQAGTVSIVNLKTGTITATLPTGNGPHETAASGDGRWGVVTNYGAQVPGSSLTVVDIPAGRVTRTIDLGFTRPHGVLFLPDNRTVAVTSETSQSVFMVDVIDGKVIGDYATDQQGSHMVALNRDGTRGYTANIGSGTISALNLRQNEAARTLRVGTQTEAIGLSPDGKEAWLGSNNTGKVFVVDIEQWRVTDSMQTSGFPYRIGFSPDGALAIVTNPGSDEIHLFETRTKARITTLRASGQPLGLIFAPQGGTAWVTLAGSGQVAEVDLIQRSIRRLLPAGPAPDGIAYADPK